MEIKKGYKMTDVGVIPEDWEVKSIGDICVVKDGTHQTPNYTYFGIPFYSVENISNNDFSNVKYISEEEHIILSSNSKIEKGDVLMTRIGSIGCCKYIDWEVKASFYVSLALLKFQDDECARYFTHYSETNLFKDEIEQNSLQFAVPQKINLGNIPKIRIILPSILKEQQLIADALTKVDNLIMSLSKVIEKKKLIKKGTMQKLLSGEMRLDGFEGEWIKIKLGDISSIKTGSRNVEEHSANGKYPFFVRSKEVMKINTFSYDEEAILVPGEGGIGEIFHYVNGKFDVHQRVYKISDFNDKVNALFIYWYMIIFFGEYAKENTVKATVDSLRLPTFTDFICCLPPTKAEQTAIADILTTMDNEIEALEKERDKYKCIKQGMMQQLLTGKIRLICQ